MSRIIAVLLMAVFHAGFVHGMDCSFGSSKNMFEKIVNSCPMPLQSADKSYCCYDIANESTYCCTAEEFAVKTGLTIIVPVVITAVVVISLIIFCISCLCCSCCPWYRKRHQGTVYGRPAMA
ncbi:hypothetical protein KM043_011192 [Ampulex compressa]|nr:hypothetical protein KM043_011192 [Ampulex compressa]